ncbi:MAG: DUF4338 domain-containing protein [Firmicutes bacterium]|nr:DUF4338 domain-containing protein [Bacillota bacterium]
MEAQEHTNATANGLSCWAGEPPLSSAARGDHWFGWTPEQPWRHLRFVANNWRFLIRPGLHFPHLASKVLAADVRRLSADWQAVCGHPVVLAETFVDPARFRGSGPSSRHRLPGGRLEGHGSLLDLLHPEQQRYIPPSKPRPNPGRSRKPVVGRVSQACP